MIDWNMVILLVFITFNVGQVCHTIGQAISIKNTIQSMPIEILKQIAEASIAESNNGGKYDKYD